MGEESELTFWPRSMYFIATSSLVSLCLKSLATPKFPAPKSLTTSYLSIWAENQGGTTKAEEEKRINWKGNREKGYEGRVIRMKIGNGVSAIRSETKQWGMIFIESKKRKKEDGIGGEELEESNWIERGMGIHNQGPAQLESNHCLLDWKSKSHFSLIKFF